MNLYSAGSISQNAHILDTNEWILDSMIKMVFHSIILKSYSMTNILFNSLLSVIRYITH